MNTLKAPDKRLIKLCLPILLFISSYAAKAQSELSKYIGKYEANGLVVQVALINKSLVMLVPGAPLQQMIPVSTNKFTTNAFSDETFLFVEKNGKQEAMISERKGQSLELKKTSDIIDDFNKGDASLILKKTTSHFSFLYSSIDSTSIDQMAIELERNYSRILHDLKVNKIPVITVRIYPDIMSFRKGINFPNAPDFISGTAFGKDDFRMVSPNAGADSATMMKGVVHELIHCVHLNIDYAPNNPRWLWEGIAMFESGWFFDPKEVDPIKNKSFPELISLNNGLDYMLGYVIIEAIKDNWGFDKVITLIKKRGDVQAVLQMTQKQFEEKIFQHIYKKYIGETH